MTHLEWEVEWASVTRQLWSSFGWEPPSIWFHPPFGPRLEAIEHALVHASRNRYHRGYDTDFIYDLTHELWVRGFEVMPREAPL